jgi:quinoprotein glucose dehydrogenase
MGGALGRLAALTEDKDARIRCEALHALASARDDAPDLNLGLLLDDDSPQVRYFAAQVVARRKLAGFFDPICEMLEQNANKDPWLRQAGAYALQQMAPDSSLLRALVNHESSAVRLAAVIGLRRIESPDVEVFLDDADPLVADEAVRTVCDLDLAEARPAVAAWFESKDAAKLTPVMLRRTMHNSFQIGDAENAATILKLAFDTTIPGTLREEAFRLLGCWAEPPPFDGFTGRRVTLDSRDPAEIVALLRKNLPTLPAQDHPGIAAAHDLAKIYQIDASIIPTPVKAAPPASTGYVDIHTPQVTRNPWLYIVIGLLVVTGILLYVDPRIF